MDKRQRIYREHQKNKKPGLKKKKKLSGLVQLETVKCHPLIQLGLRQLALGTSSTLHLRYRCFDLQTCKRPLPIHDIKNLKAQSSSDQVSEGLQSAFELSTVNQLFGMVRTVSYNKTGMFPEKMSCPGSTQWCPLVEVYSTSLYAGKLLSPVFLVLLLLVLPPFCLNGL